MDQTQLDQKEQAITESYKAFLRKVKEAFNHHCDEIKEHATDKFNTIPEEDQEGRKKVLAEQKAELDKSLTELKSLLSKRGAEVRDQLEEIANLRDQGDFDLDAQLSQIEEIEKEGHAV